MCTLIDPSDPGLKNKLNPARFPLTITFDEFPNICIKCKVRVRGSSKHCRACDRCTADFDHHCYWVNNCIAKSNYRWFLALVTAVEAMTALQTYASMHLVAVVVVDRVTGSKLLKGYDIGDSGYFFFSGIVIVALVSLFFTISNGFLLCFHVYLRIRRISTFEYLMSNRRSNTKIHPMTMKYSTTAGITSQLTLNETIHAQQNQATPDNCGKVRGRMLIVPLADVYLSNEEASKGKENESRGEAKKEDEFDDREKDNQRYSDESHSCDISYV